MTYANLRTIPSLIAKRQPFEGNSMRAIAPKGRDQDGNYIANMGRLFAHPDDQDKFRGKVLDYIIFSYGTPIAAITSDGDAIQVEGKFSVTTSRHQSTAAHGLNLGGLI